MNNTCVGGAWTNICELIPYCEKVMKISSICKICANSANYNFKHSGTSQDFDEMIGGAEKYMPLCRECFNEKTRQ